jgi:TPR repeat protein
MTSGEIRTYNTVLTKATNGDPLAQYNVGVCFSAGLGVEKDSAKALGWWRKSAAQGNAPAMYNLGYSYMNAVGVQADLVLGVSWYRKSAELGHVPAMCNLGICYDEGVGVSPDFKEAIKWLGKAVAKGDKAAILHLELMQSRLAAPAAKTAALGGKERDAPVAATQPGQSSNMTPEQVNSFRGIKANADRGDPVAQHAAGLSYLLGVGVAKDEVAAYAYFSLSGRSYEPARSALGQLEKKLSTHESAAGQKRTKQLQEEIAAKKIGKGA